MVPAVSSPKKLVDRPPSISSEGIRREDARSSPGRRRLPTALFEAERSGESIGSPNMRNEEDPGWHAA